MKKRIVAFMMTLVMSVSLISVPAQAKSTDTASLSSLDIINNGYPMLDIGNVIIGMRQVNELLYSITGNKAFSSETFNVVADDMVQGFTNYILDLTGIDFSKIYKNLPNTSQASEWLTKTFNIDTVELQKTLNDKVAELASQNKNTEAMLVRWVAIWMGIIKECKLRCIPVDGQPGLYQLGATVTYKDGRTDTVRSSMYFNSKTNQFTGIDGKTALIGFNMDLSQAMTYSGVDVWMRNMGFCLFYDIFCYSTLFLNYTTQRIKFDYDGREWMIQLWKGRYLITNGGEVGVYNRAMGSTGSYYDCASDDDMLYISLDVYHNDKLLVHRDPMYHWWITGFGVSNTAYLPTTMTMVSTIQMKDKEMLDAFTKALKKKWYCIKYSVDGLNVTFTWK